jgi:hypothetical protein
VEERRQVPIVEEQSVDRVVEDENEVEDRRDGCGGMTCLSNAFAFLICLSRVEMMPWERRCTLRLASRVGRTLGAPTPVTTLATPTERSDFGKCAYIPRAAGIRIRDLLTPRYSRLGASQKCGLTW